MSADQRQASVKLEGEEISVQGEGLQSPRMSLFFRGVLGCRPEGDGWTCPTRGAAGSDLVVQISRQMERAGFMVAADGASADLALKNEIERVRSFARARAAGAAFLGLSTGAGAATTLPEGDVLAALERAGWDSTARPLLPHQRRGLMHALSSVNAANFSVPGAGKTATALSVIATHLERDNIDTIVVVGPLSCFSAWEREAAAALPGVLTTRRVRSMTRVMRTAIYQRARSANLLLLSFATAASDRQEIEHLCRRQRVMLIVDESHRIKRFRGGTWSPALVSIARYARVKLILTGTPMPQGPTDLWSQFMILWPGEEATGSRAAFAARTDASFQRVVSDLEPFFTRTPKSELGLREVRFIRHPVEMPELQREIYALIVRRLRGAITDAARWQDRIDALRRARPIRLLQAASNPDLLNEADGFFHVPPLTTASGTLMERLARYREFGELPAKFAWALDLLDGMQRNGDKCVVWTSFVRNIDQFSELARPRLDGPVFSVDGRVPAADTSADQSPNDELDETRERRIDQFLSAAGFALLIANPAACGESISLHSGCHTAIYLDRTHDCARWLQSIDRIHRLGLPRDVQVEIHIPQAFDDGQGTIDLLVDQSLDAKSARMRELLEGAELRAGLGDQDTLGAAEGSVKDLDALLHYLLGEA